MNSQSTSIDPISPVRAIDTNVTNFDPLLSPDSISSDTTQDDDIVDSLPKKSRLVTTLLSACSTSPLIGQQSKLKSSLRDNSESSQSTLFHRQPYGRTASTPTPTKIAGASNGDKDEQYRARRIKNNEAARRSRDKKKQEEMARQIRAEHTIAYLANQIELNASNSRSILEKARMILEAPDVEEKPQEDVFENTLRVTLPEYVKLWQNLGHDLDRIMKEQSGDTDNTDGGLKTLAGIQFAQMANRHQSPFQSCEGPPNTYLPAASGPVSPVHPPQQLQQQDSPVLEDGDGSSQYSAEVDQDEDSGLAFSTPKNIIYPTPSTDTVDSSSPMESHFDDSRRAPQLQVARGASSFRPGGYSFGFPPSLLSTQQVSDNSNELAMNASLFASMPMLPNRNFGGMIPDSYPSPQTTMNRQVANMQISNSYVNPCGPCIFPPTANWGVSSSPYHPLRDDMCQAGTSQAQFHHQPEMFPPTSAMMASYQQQIRSPGQQQPPPAHVNNTQPAGPPVIPYNSSSRLG